ASEMGKELESRRVLFRSRLSELVRSDRAVDEVLCGPVRTVVMRGRRVAQRPRRETVATEGLRVHVLVEVDDRVNPPGPGGSEELVVPREPIGIVLALGRFEGGP